MRRRNALDREIAAILGRPVHSGHFGEYVAAAIFGIALNPSASAKGHDGRFTDGPAAGKSVNIKYQTKRKGLLAVVASHDPADHPDYYLVLTGPRAPAATTRGTAAPWVINAVYLFESKALLEALNARGIQPGIVGVGVQQWEDAMVYPNPRNPRLPLTPDQRAAIALFREEQL
jgi:hypothetical protein